MYVIMDPPEKETSIWKTDGFARKGIHTWMVFHNMYVSLVEGWISRPKHTSHSFPSYSYGIWSHRT